jgi:hypothetical protein
MHSYISPNNLAPSRKKTNAKHITAIRENKEYTFEAIKSVKRIIGRSLIIGARATLIPDLTPCCRDSEITSVRSGPGAKPAERPNMIPIIRKSVTAVRESYRPEQYKR